MPSPYHFCRRISSTLTGSFEIECTHPRFAQLEAVEQAEQLFGLALPAFLKLASCVRPKDLKLGYRIPVEQVGNTVCHANCGLTHRTDHGFVAKHEPGVRV